MKNRDHAQNPQSDTSLPNRWSLANAVRNGGVPLDNRVIRIGTGTISSGLITICPVTQCQAQTFIAGIPGVTPGLVSIPVFIDSNGQLGTIPSSRRFKYDIQNMGAASSDLLKLRSVTFRYKQAQNDGSYPLQYGLVAEEVADVDPGLVAFDKAGEPQTVLYQGLERGRLDYPSDRRTLRCVARNSLEII